MAIPRFRVGVTRDMLSPDGPLRPADIGLDFLEKDERVVWETLAAERRELAAGDVAAYDALLVGRPRVTAETLDGVERLVLVARFGVGYDNVDVEALTGSDVLLTITPEGVRRPVASAVMTFLLALSHRLLTKDRLIRTGRWAERLLHMGTGLAGKTLGVVGLGNIGREVLRLARPFDMVHLASDPHVRAQDIEDIEEVGVALVELEDLLRRADFVCITCSLTPATRHLIDATRLTLMKRTAYLINVARGPVVDQAALVAALTEGRIQGAGLDVFEKEPIDPHDPLLELENVILAPHALSWTDECFRGIGRSACRSILAVAAGSVPEHVVNRDVLEKPGLEEKLRRHGQRKEAT
ncbi:MAG: NAD(P)-dependent oxidoreductase [Planctomycetota bacterium]|nr:NAD(P)-dependent oxidoreductase [Planctomycetota bacterium]